MKILPWRFLCSSLIISLVSNLRSKIGQSLWTLSYLIYIAEKVGLIDSLLEVCANTLWAIAMLS